MKTSCITVFSDSEVRANREASEIVSALRKTVLGDNFAWRKLFHAGNYLDARLEQIFRDAPMPEPSCTVDSNDNRCIPDEPQYQSGNVAAC